LQVKASEESQSLAIASRLINSVAAATSIRDREGLYHSIARLLLQLVDAHSVALLRLSDDSRAKHLVARAVVNRGVDQLDSFSRVGSAHARMLAAMSGWQRCIERDEIVQCPAQSDRTMNLFPIPGERHPVGVLAINANGTVPRQTSELVRGVLRIFANHLALLDYGEVDTLTGLLNRKTFESYFEKVRLRLMRTVVDRVGIEASWLALLDIDRFKAINDGHGHLVGDEILLLVSQIMKRNFRGADQLFRFGGEEFVAILDHASDAGARIGIERLRTAVEEHSFPQIGRVTLSAGYTRVLPQDIPTTCVERADAALYFAKSLGRNNVQSFEAMVAAGEVAGGYKTGAVDLF
jgi:diguanylate cyclase (GGDEF)-like protein